MAWNANKPAADDTLAVSQGHLLQNFEQIQTDIAVEHVKQGAAAGTPGVHQFNIRGKTAPTTYAVGTPVTGSIQIVTNAATDSNAYWMYYTGSAWTAMGNNANNEKIYGAKTFAQAITLPGNPSSSLQAATKGYVDGTLSITTGYGSAGGVIFPSGLYMQWGFVENIPVSGTTNVSFTTPFPNGCVNIQLTVRNATPAEHPVATVDEGSITDSGFAINGDATAGTVIDVTWLAIGF